MPKYGKTILNYRFHNPNTKEDTASFLVELFVEVNKPKANAAILEAANEYARENRYCSEQNAAC